MQVWVADASVYEGILHTATFDNPEGLGVVLSMATRKVRPGAVRCGAVGGTGGARPPSPWLATDPH